MFKVVPDERRDGSRLLECGVGQTKSRLIKYKKYFVCHLFMFVLLYFCILFHFKLLNFQCHGPTCTIYFMYSQSVINCLHYPTFSNHKRALPLNKYY